MVVDQHDADAVAGLNHSVLLRRRHRLRTRSHPRRPGLRCSFSGTDGIGRRIE